MTMVADYQPVDSDLFVVFVLHVLAHGLVDGVACCFCSHWGCNVVLVVAVLLGFCCCCHF